jgi:hypothetical protein
MKDTKNKVPRPRRWTKKPLGTRRNPWYAIVSFGKRRYFRMTPFGIWMVDRLPKNAIIRENSP